MKTDLTKQQELILISTYRIQSYTQPSACAVVTINRKAVFRSRMVSFHRWGEKEEEEPPSSANFPLYEYDIYGIGYTCLPTWSAAPEASAPPSLSS